MSKHLRSLSLVAALASAFAAEAGPVAINLDFTAEGNTTEATSFPGATVNPVNGLTFQSASAFGVRKASSLSVLVPNPVQAGGILFAQVGASQSNPFVIDVMNGLDEFKFDKIALDLFGNANGGTTIRVYDANNVKVLDTGTTGSFDGVNYLYAPVSFQLAAGSVIDRIEFSAGDASRVGIDNLSLSSSQTGGGGGGTVPEPASFGLVALALAGVGLSRRRRSAA